MRIEATDVIAQTVRDRNPIEDAKVPVGVTYGRSSKLAQIEENAVDFASDFLLEFDLPSSPILRLGNVQGFENLKQALSEIIGVIHVEASFKTLSGYTVRFDLAIPLHKGEFIKPSIATYNGKKHIMSQELINSILASMESTRPTVQRPLTPEMNFTHPETIERPLFSAPEDPTGWSRLITERY
jgi:hypothetical protein